MYARLTALPSICIMSWLLYSAHPLPVHCITPLTTTIWAATFSHKQNVHSEQRAAVLTEIDANGQSLEQGIKILKANGGIKTYRGGNNNA